MLPCGGALILFLTLFSYVRLSSCQIDFLSGINRLFQGPNTNLLGGNNGIGNAVDTDPNAQGAKKGEGTLLCFFSWSLGPGFHF